jgi:hypothetical protein
MADQTHQITSNGLETPVLIGLSGSDVHSRIAANLPLRRPQRGIGLIDTGTNVTAVAASVLHRLGIVASRTVGTQTFGGLIQASLFDVSLTITNAGWTAGDEFTISNLEVMEFVQPISGLDAIIGMDVVRLCQLHIDGPARQFTLTF